MSIRSRLKSALSRAIKRGKEGAKRVKAGGRPSGLPSRKPSSKPSSKPTPSKPTPSKPKPSKPKTTPSPTSTTITLQSLKPTIYDDPTTRNVEQPDYLQKRQLEEARRAVQEAKARGQQYKIVNGRVQLVDIKTGKVLSSAPAPRGRSQVEKDIEAGVIPTGATLAEPSAKGRDVRTLADTLKQQFGLFDRLDKLREDPKITPSKVKETQQVFGGLTSTSIVGGFTGAVVGIGTFAISAVTKPKETATSIVAGTTKIASDIKAVGVVPYFAPKFKDLGQRIRYDPTRVVEIGSGAVGASKLFQFAGKVGRIAGSQPLKLGRKKIDPSKVISPQVLDGSKRFPTIPKGQTPSSLFAGRFEGISATAGFPTKITDILKDVRKKPIEIAGTDPNIKKALFVTPVGEASPYFLRRQTFGDIFKFRAEREALEYLGSRDVSLGAKASFLVSPFKRLLPTYSNIRALTAQPRFLKVQVGGGFLNIPSDVLQASRRRIQEFGRGTRLYELEEFARQSGLKGAGVAGGRVSLELTKEIEGLISGRIQKVSSKEFTTFAGEVIPIDQYKLLPSLRPPEKIPANRLPNLLRKPKAPKTKIQPSYKPKLDLPKYVPSYKPRYTPSYTPKYDPTYTPKYTPSYTPSYTPKFDFRPPIYDPRYDPKPPVYAPPIRPPFLSAGGGYSRRIKPKGSKVGGRFTRSFTAEVLGIKAPRKRKLKQRYTGFELRI
jgi:hypothetical protein